MCSPSDKTYEVARPPRKGRCSNSRTRSPASASATPAASPASPPPITITFFEDIIPGVPPEFCAGDEDHFIRFAEPDTFAKHREVQRFDAGQQRVVSMHQKPQGAAAVGIDQIEQLGAFCVELPGAISLKA